MVYQARKQLSAASDKLQQNLKDLVEKAAAELEEEIKTDDVDKIRASMDRLQKQIMEMGSSMYSQQSADVEKPKGTQETSSDNREVLDADFTSQK